MILVLELKERLMPKIEVVPGAFHRGECGDAPRTTQ